MENNEITVNDGGGLYDDIGLIDTLVVDCNELLGLLISGRFVAFCSTISSMVQRLGSLRESLARQQAAAGGAGEADNDEEKDVE